MTFKPGQSGNPKGRFKGSTNKITKDLKTAYLEAFELRGGVQGLLDWSEKSPDAFYGQISKMLPKEMVADVQSSIELRWGVRPGLPDPNVIEGEITTPELPEPDGTALPVNSNKVSESDD